MTAAASHSDVLIVGAGSAGSVVASCLSTDPSCSVTVVEAGAAIVDPGLRAEVANGVRLPIGSASPLVQRYETRLTDRPARAMAIVRGATVGGSGAVNGGYFCRGLPRDFDQLGLAGWAWPDVSGHFRAIETDLDFAGPAHGDAGPILVQRVDEMVGATAAFVDNAREFGMSWAPDLNDVTDVGDGGLPSAIGPVPLNIVDGSRIGPGAAFLAPALTRANLTLLAGHRVLRLRFSGSRVVGVEALGPGGPVVLQAERVVLCAGAIESAHLLMLSGFGSEKMLHALGIDVRVPLQVGTATSDHPEWVLPAPWAVTPGRPVLEVVLSTPDDIEIRPYTGGFVAMVGDGSAGHPDWPHMGVALMRPRARGRIVLTSADPMTPPAIEHRYDSEPADLAALQAGCELARDIVSPTIQLGEPAWSTSQHLCGSAPMGPGYDPSTVVDEQCRVHGVEGLWVIDGSVLPTVPSRGPHATIVMLGHRAAEFVT